MTVFRVHKTRDYTVMSNRHLRDGRLSLKAKGLLSLILSLPDDWEYSIAGLAAISKEGANAIKTALDELRACGYVTLNKKYPGQTASGRIEYEYDIHECPQLQEVEKQGVENQAVEVQCIENHAQLSTEGRITDEPTKEERKKDDESSAIIAYLNEKSGKSFKAGSDSTRRLIRARLAEGYTVEDFRRVIDNKCATWKGDAYWSTYLRPQTLFCASKFEGYLNERGGESDARWEKYR